MASMSQPHYQALALPKQPSCALHPITHLWTWGKPFTLVTFGIILLVGLLFRVTFGRPLVNFKKAGLAQTTNASRYP